MSFRLMTLLSIAGLLGTIYLNIFFMNEWVSVLTLIIWMALTWIYLPEYTKWVHDINSFMYSLWTAAPERILSWFFRFLASFIVVTVAASGTLKTPIGIFTVVGCIAFIVVMEIKLFFLRRKKRANNSAPDPMNKKSKEDQEALK